MTHERPGADADGADPLRSMRAERVERDDGRYLVYFSWDAPEADRGADANAQPRTPSPEEAETTPASDGESER